MSGFRSGGVISANGDEVISDIRGYASATISISGTFAGDITVIGANSISAAEGGRILFQSGVGSTGRNVASFDGTISREYRVVLGGERLIVRASNWVSGSAEIEVYSTPDASLVFVNGPVHNAIEEATRAKRAFTGGLTPAAATSSDVAHIIVENPDDSGVFLFVTKRKFDNDNAAGDDNKIYQAYANPTVDVSAWDDVVPVNLYLGGPASSAIISTFVGTAQVMGGISGSGEILPNGVPYDRELLSILEPGTRLGFTLEGSGGAGNASTLSIIFEFYEEDLQ